MGIQAEPLYNLTMRSRRETILRYGLNAELHDKIKVEGFTASRPDETF